MPLVLSSFALTVDWPPSRLAEDTNFHDYRTVAAATLRAAGFPLWPTAIWEDGVPEPRNEVHYDLVVTVVTPEQVRATLAGSDSERRQARQALAPRFEVLFARLGAAVPLASPGTPDADTLDQGRS